VVSSTRGARMLLAFPLAASWASEQAPLAVYRCAWVLPQGLLRRSTKDEIVVNKREPVPDRFAH